MCASRPAMFFSIVLILVFSTSTVCFAFPIGSVGQVGQAPGGCHNHRGPMPKPSPMHACCFAAHQVLATSIGPAPIALDTAVDQVVSAPSSGEHDALISGASQVLDTSPPLKSVLRI